MLVVFCVGGLLLFAAKREREKEMILLTIKPAISYVCVCVCECVCVCVHTCPFSLMQLFHHSHLPTYTLYVISNQYVCIPLDLLTHKLRVSIA